MWYSWTFLYKVHLAVNIYIVKFFCDSGYWPTKAEAVSGGKMKVGKYDNPSAVFCPCSLRFRENSVKAVTHDVFLRLQIFSSIYRETHSAGFSAAGLNACNFIKKVKETICSTGMFGSFWGSDHSNPGCPDYLLWVCHLPPPSPPLQNTSLQVCSVVWAPLLPLWPACQWVSKVPRFYWPIYLLPSILTSSSVFSDTSTRRSRQMKLKGSF